MGVSGVERLAQVSGVYAEVSRRAEVMEVEVLVGMSGTAEVLRMRVWQRWQAGRGFADRGFGTCDRVAGGIVDKVLQGWWG